MNSIHSVNTKFMLNKQEDDKTLHPNYLNNQNVQSNTYYHQTKEEEINTYNNTHSSTTINMKKKHKNSLKNSKEDDLNNNQNLRSVKINWNKYDNLFKRIPLERNYEGFILEQKNIKDEDTINDEKTFMLENNEDKEDDAIYCDLSNINFKTFFKDYNDILNKLNLIKLNDKTNFKNNCYSQLYEEIFLIIEKFLDISHLKYHNNITFICLYKVYISWYKIKIIIFLT